MEHNVCTGISNVRYFSPRLLAALTGILSSPLTVIEAPMGYGKTVAVREFLRRENLAVIWVSVLDSPDGAFWRSLCRELERLPETAETARALRSLGPPFAPDDAARRDAALELLESLDFARPTVLVVDDVHLLASAPSCVRFFQILARQAMSNLHIVLTTRHFQTDDALLADLKGELARLGPALLAFSEEDIRAYCALCGLKISPDQIPAWGHGRMGQRRISALPPLRATRGFFPARLRPFFHPALPAIFLLIFPAVFRERTATGYGRPFGRTALSPTLPGRAGHAFRALSA